MHGELDFMKVLSMQGCNIYIYDDEHPPPHCHVIFNDGSETVVGLPFLDCWYGKTLKKKLKRFLEEHIDQLIDVWENKHPERN